MLTLIMTWPCKIRRRGKSIKTNDIDINPYKYAVQVQSKRDQDGNPILNKNGKRVYLSSLKRLKTLDSDLEYVDHNLANHIPLRAIPHCKKK